MKKKVNPHRKPATQGDVLKAKKDAQSLAIKYAFALMFSTMRDKEGYGAVRLQRLWRRVGDLADSVSAGYLSLDDLIETLEKEDGIRLSELGKVDRI